MKVKSKRFRIRRMKDGFYYVQEKRFLFLWCNMYFSKSKVVNAYYNYADAYADAVWQCKRVAKKPKPAVETFVVFYEV